MKEYKPSKVTTSIGGMERPTTKKLTDLVTVEVTLKTEASDIILEAPASFLQTYPNARCNPYSLMREVEEEGYPDLAASIRRGVDSYRCVRCGKGDRVGMAMLEDRLVFFCIWCSGDEVKEVWERG